MGTIAHLDTIDGSSVDWGQVTKEKVRGGWVDGLSGDPGSAVEQCLTASGMPTLGEQINVNGWTLYFSRLVVGAISGDACRVQLIYDNGGLPPTAYIIRSKASLQPFQTHIDPNTGKNLKVKWTDPNGNAPAITDSVTFTIPEVVREVSVSGVRFGTPDTKLEDAVGYVNQATWRNRQTGMWLITDGGTDLSRFQGTYQFYITAATRPVRDWSEVGTLFNKLSGKYVDVSDADYQKLLTNDGKYQTGIMTTVNGAIRWGPHPVTDFKPLFGF